MKNNYLNILLISGSGLVGGLINYIYHPIMLQYMALEEFGEFGSLVGLFSILAVLTSGFGLFLTREVAKNIHDTSYVKNILFSSMKIFSSIGVAIYLLYLLLSPYIARFLDIPTFFVAVTGIVIVTSFISVSLGSTLVGMRKFEFVGMSSISHPFAKLIIGGGAVFFGYGLAGALSGFILSGILSLLGSLIFLLYFFSDIKTTGNPVHIYTTFRNNKKSIINFLLVSIAFSLLMNGDVILARNLFSPDLAGAYAGVSILGKFLLYMLLSVETVYYGQILEHEQKKLPLYLVRNALGLMGIATAFAFFVNFFFGSSFLHFLNPTLTTYTSLYLCTLVYYCFLAFISIFSKILIAWNVYKVNIFLLSLVVSTLLTVYTFGYTTLESYILVLIANISVGCICIGGLFFYELTRHQR